MDKTGDVGGVWLWRGRRLRACHRSILNVVGHAVGGACGGRGLLWPGMAVAGAHLEFIGGVEGYLADFGEALAVAHSVAQRQLREL